MGYIATVIVNNGSLSIIEKDPDFGKKLAEAIRLLGRYREGHINLSANARVGSFVNAATVICQSHSHDRIVVEVSGGCAQVILPS